MIDFLIYLLVAFGATFIGAMAGLGGGVIIKPLLGILNDYSVANINFLAGCTVFTMALVSTLRAGKRKEELFTDKSILLIIGSIIGGFIGATLFNNLIENVSNEQIIVTIQSGLLIGLFIFVLVVRKINPQINLKLNKAHLLLSGIIMGMTAAFLGIGGGPVNMIVLLILFRYSVKDAVVTSTLIILFAQLTSILTTLFTVDMIDYQLEMLMVMIPGAIIGGILGSKFVSKFNENTLSKIFNVTITSLIFITAFQIFI